MSKGLRKFSFFISTIFFFTFNLFSLGPDSLWTKTYGGTPNEQCYSVKQTSDGGYIAAGSF